MKMENKCIANRESIFDSAINFGYGQEINISDISNEDLVYK
jgi:hypothetical protein